MARARSRRCTSVQQSSGRDKGKHVEISPKGEISTLKGCSPYCRTC